MLCGVGNLGALPNPPILRVIPLGQLGPRVLEHTKPQSVSRRIILHLAERLHDLIRGTSTSSRVGSPDLLDPPGRSSIPIRSVPTLLWEDEFPRRRAVLSGVMTMLRGQPPDAGHHLRDRHVRMVDVRAFLSVDLDRNEGIVHEPRHFVVLEGFVLHHVAPVARGITDGEEYRFVFSRAF